MRAWRREGECAECCLTSRKLLARPGNSNGGDGRNEEEQLQLRPLVASKSAFNSRETDAFSDSSSLKVTLERLPQCYKVTPTRFQPFSPCLSLEAVLPAAP